MAYRIRDFNLLVPFHSVETARYKGEEVEKIEVKIDDNVRNLIPRINKYGGLRFRGWNFHQLHGDHDMYERCKMLRAEARQRHRY